MKMLNLNTSSASLALLIGMMMQSNVFANGQASVSGGEKTVNVSTTLATGTYVGTEGIRRLSFIKATLAPPTFWEKDEYYKKHPEGSGIPNTAFSLVDSLPDEISNGKVLMVIYEAEDLPFIAPRANWYSDVAWNPSNKTAVVLLVKSRVLAVDLKVYQASPAKPLAKFPLELPSQKRAEWPKPTEPLSEFKTSISSDSHGQCGISDVKAEIIGDELVVSAHREDKGCPPTIFHFNLTTKGWTVDNLSVTKVPPQK